MLVLVQHIRPHKIHDNLELRFSLISVIIVVFGGAKLRIMSP